jgi:hypothetical protein
MSLAIYAWNEHSEGARQLATALGVRRIRQGPQSTYRGRAGKTVINWGSSVLPANVEGSRILNNPARVAAMSNKRTFFELIGNTDARLPRYSTDRATARQWNTRVVERHILNGHSGAGIVIRENSLDIGVAPLYTEYVPKKAEYRVHFGGGGDVIDVQRKIRDPAREPTNWHVRSHDNGFIYVRDGVRENMPGDVIEQALLVARESGLEFGAIDVIYNQSRGEAYVLEVNTAPGLTGETVNSYANYFRQFL